jgi:hypothetical protein
MCTIGSKTRGACTTKSGLLGTRQHEAMNLPTRLAKSEKLPRSWTANREQDQADIAAIMQRRLANSIGRAEITICATLIFIKTDKATPGI